VCDWPGEQTEAFRKKIDMVVIDSSRRMCPESAPPGLRR
jgi:hypothetical protein